MTYCLVYDEYVYIIYEGLLVKIYLNRYVCMLYKEVECAAQVTRPSTNEITNCRSISVTKLLVCSYLYLYLKNVFISHQIVTTLSPMKSRTIIHGLNLFIYNTKCLQVELIPRQITFQSHIN